MRKLITTIATAGVLGMAAISLSFAAPVPGFEAQYSAVFASCTIPAGPVPVPAAASTAARSACEAAINAYSGALATSVELAVANESFTALRLEVFAANAPDKAFQTMIDALFELLLPDSGALGPVVASPTA